MVVGLVGCAPDPSSRVACRDQSDCLDGFVCAAQTCVSSTEKAARALRFVVQPGFSVGVGEAIEVQVAAVDEEGEPALGFEDSVRLELLAQGAVVPFQGVATAKAVAGVAVFRGLSIAFLGMDYVFRAHAGSLGEVTGEPFSVTSSDGAKVLAFVPVPASVTAGATVPGIQVKALSASGVLDTLSLDSVTLSLGVNPGGSSFTPVAASLVSGVAEFEGVSFDQIASGYRLVASAKGYVSGLSAPIDVFRPGKATRLTFLEDVEDAQAGSILTPAPEVMAVDDLGTVDVSFEGPIELRLDAPQAVLLGARVLSAQAGRARFTELSVSRSENDLSLFASTLGLKDGASRPFDALGRARFVDGNTGSDDQNNCDDAGRPCRTPSYAFERMQCGEVALIHGGATYQEPWLIEEDCPVGSERVIAPWPATGMPTVTSSVATPAVTIRSANTRLQGIQILGGEGDGILVSGNRGVVVEDCVVRDRKMRGIALFDGFDHIVRRNLVESTTLSGILVVKPTRTVQILSNRVFGSLKWGIRLHGGALVQGNDLAFNDSGISASADVSILNNRIHQSTFQGIFVGADRARIENNTIHGNAQQGIQFGPPAEGGVVRNNIFSENGVGILTTHEDGEPEVDHNLFFASEKEHCKRANREDCTRTEDANILDVDPSYVDETSFHLRPDSIAIDRGEPGAACDREPEPRPCRINLGAWGNTTSAAVR